MQITTERLWLVPVGPEHLESTHAYSSDPENTRLMIFLPYESLEETAAHIREAVAMWNSDVPEYLEFAVMLGEENIGGVTLYLLGGRTAELGWILDRHHWGRGYAGEAVRAAMDYGRRERGIRRFIAQCDSENEASYRLMQRLGMTCIDRDGRRKNRSSDEESGEMTWEIYV